MSVLLYITMSMLSQFVVRQDADIMNTSNQEMMLVIIIIILGPFPHTSVIHESTKYVVE